VVFAEPNDDLRGDKGLDGVPGLIFNPTLAADLGREIGLTKIGGVPILDALEGNRV